MSQEAPLSVSSVPAVLVRYPLPVLLFLCLIAWLPGFFSLPPTDRDESRFAQASKQMIETGDLVNIHYSSGARYNKPIGIYWLQSAAAKIASTPPYNRVWAYRIPSLIGGILAIFFVYWCGLAFASPPVALAGAGLMTATLLLNVEARIATTDAVLLAAVMASQAVLARFYLAARENRPPPGAGIAMAGWIALGIGILIKGPVIAIVLALTIIPLSLWDRDWTWLRKTRPVAGVALALLIVLPWAIAIAFASHGAFYEQSLGHDFAAKVMGGQESHGAPPGYYLALVTLTFWPATLFLLPGLRHGILHRAQPAFRFLLVWIVVNWIVFELVPTKLPHYILPLYPPLALLGAMWALRRDKSEKGSGRVLRGLAALQFLFALVAMAGAIVFLPAKFGTGTSAILIIAACAAGLAGLAALGFFMRGQYVAAAAGAITSAVVMFATLAAGVAPTLGTIWLSPRAAALVAQHRQADDPPVALAGYVEPSLVFLLGTGTFIGNGETAATAAAGHGGLALVDDKQKQAFLDRLAALHGHAKVTGAISGLDYSRGKREHLTLYRVTPGH